MRKKKAVANDDDIKLYRCNNTLSECILIRWHVNLFCAVLSYFH